MVWIHCDNEAILDDAGCPDCGMTKAEWTIKVGSTRVFKVGKKKQKGGWLELAVLGTDGDFLRDPIGYTIDLPSGKRVTGELNGGQARVEDVPPGACLVTLDGLRLRPDDAPEPAPEGGPRLLVGDPAPDEESGFMCDANALHTFRRCHWIELSVNDEFGFPLADEPFEVEFEDETPKVEGMLDANGSARVDGLLRGGPCAVHFPRRQLREMQLEPQGAAEA